MIRSDRTFPFPPFWIIGLVGWGALSFGLSRACVTKFRRMANRLPIGAASAPAVRRGPPPLPKRPADTSRGA